MITLRTICLAAAALAAAQTAPHADESAPERIVVTGTRLPMLETEIGSSVSVITAADIDARGYSFVFDALAAAPGVTINQNGPFGGVATVRIRGNSSEQTLVLIDGVPVNDPTSPGGGYDFAALDTANVERIEILKGPQSTLWGSDAIGGVVNIVTKTPEPGLGGTAFADYGSFDTWHGGAAFEGANDAGDFRLAASGTTTDGISKADERDGNTEEDGFETYALAARGGLALPGQARLEGTLRHVDADNDYDSFGAVTGVVDGDENSKTKETSGSLALRLPLLDGRLDNLFLAGYASLDRDNFSGGLPSFSSEGERAVYRYQGTLTIDDRNRLAVGAEHEASEANGDDTTIDGYFGLYELKPVEGLTFSAGLRLDDHETFGEETTGRAALAWSPVSPLTLRASWGQGFKAPTIFQTTFFCCGATAPNADLKAETSEAYDIGAEWRFARGSAGITYFDQATENLITFDFGIGGYDNIAVAETTGIELTADYAVTDWLTAQIDYAYIDAQDGTGQPLVRVPDHSGDLALIYDAGGPFSGTLVVRHNGEETDSYGPLDAWTRVDLSGTYSINETFALYGRVENLFDTDYQQVFGYGTPGLSGRFGIKLKV